MRRVGANKGQAMRFDHFCKISIFPDKSQRLMKRITTCNGGRAQDGWNVQIGVSSRWSADKTDSSAKRTGMELESAVEWTTTRSIPISLQARNTRNAISPLFAIRFF